MPRKPPFFPNSLPSTLVLFSITIPFLTNPIFTLPATRRKTQLLIRDHRLVALPTSSPPPSAATTTNSNSQHPNTHLFHNHLFPIDIHNSRHTTHPHKHHPHQTRPHRQIPTQPSPHPSSPTSPPSPPRCMRANPRPRLRNLHATSHTLPPELPTISPQPTDVTTPPPFPALEFPAPGLSPRLHSRPRSAHHKHFDKLSRAPSLPS